MEMLRKRNEELEKENAMLRERSAGMEYEGESLTSKEGNEKSSGVEVEVVDKIGDFMLPEKSAGVEVAKSGDGVVKEKEDKGKPKMEMPEKSSTDSVPVVKEKEDKGKPKRKLSKAEIRRKNWEHAHKLKVSRLLPEEIVTKVEKIFLSKMKGATIWRKPEYKWSFLASEEIKVILKGRQLGIGVIDSHAAMLTTKYCQPDNKFIILQGSVWNLIVFEDKHSVIKKRCRIHKDLAKYYDGSFGDTNCIQWWQRSFHSS